MAATRWTVGTAARRSGSFRTTSPSSSNLHAALDSSGPTFRATGCNGCGLLARCGYGLVRNKSEMHHNRCFVRSQPSCIYQGRLCANGHGSKVPYELIQPACTCVSVKEIKIVATLIHHAWRGDLFLLYRCNRRFSSVSLGRPKTLRSICCFQAGWGSGCRRKAKVRCLTFSSTRQLYGASSFCLNF